MTGANMIDGAKLKKYRLQAGLSRPGLSEKSGVPVRTLEDWESGRRIPQDIDRVQKIISVLGISVYDIFSDRILGELNSQALTENEFRLGTEEAELDNLVSIAACRIGTGKLLNRFIGHLGIQESIRLVREVIENEGS